MKQLLSRMFLTFTMALSIAFTPTAVVLAGNPSACPNGSSARGQVLQGVGETGSNCDASGVGSAIGSIVSILSYIAGAVAVIMVIISGFKYITSGGDSNSVSSAKTTLVYALVGIAVAALAQFLVHYVLTNA